MKIVFRLPAMIALLALVAVATGTAQTQISSSVIGSGQTVATNGTVVAVGTVGQPVIGPTTSSATTAGQGFWYTLPLGPITSVRDNSAVAGSTLTSAPNPFSEYTDVRVNLQTTGDVELKLFDAAGRFVRTLAAGHYPAGVMIVRIGAGELESGHYTLSLSAGTTHRSMTLTVVK
jgi:hypothetical protein